MSIPSRLISENAEVDDSIHTQNIFGPKVQLTSFTSRIRAFKVNENTIQLNVANNLSNPQEDLLLASDPDQKERQGFGNISLLKNIRLAAKKFKIGMSAKPIYDLNKKFLDLIYDFTMAKLPQLNNRVKSDKLYLKKRNFFLQSNLLLTFTNWKGYALEKLDAIPIILPENKLKMIWDFFIIFLTFFLFFIYPIQMAFNLKSFLLNDSEENSFIIQQWLSVIFTFLLATDIILKFFSAYYEKGFLITKKSLIIKNYWKTSFFSDFFTFISVGIELNDVLAYRNKSLFFNITSKILKSFIFLKLVEINKYLCLMEEIIHFGEKGIAFFRLFKLAISIFFFSHIMGCLWHVVCYYGPYEKNILKSTNFYDVDWTTRYLRCLFFTINPGRVDPQNNLEMAFGYFALLASSGSIGFMISSIQNITRSFNKNEEIKRNSIRIISAYMKKRGIAFDYQNKIRKYLDYLYDDQNDNKLIEQKLIGQLSTSLKQELLMRSNGETIANFAFFKNNFSEETLKKITLSLMNKNYFPEEIIMKMGKEDDSTERNLFFILEGEISVYYHKNIEEKTLYTLKKGEFFNEYSFVTGQKSPFYIKALTQTALLKLSYLDFITILNGKKKDYQKFCLLRDKIILNNNIFLLSTECRSCGLKDHLIENCEQIHMVMNRGVKIRQHLHSKPINERRVFFRKRKKINSLKIIGKFMISTSNFEDSSIFEDENDANTQSFETLNVLEVESNSKKEATINEIKKETIPGNVKKMHNYSVHDANDSIFTTKLDKKKKTELNLDKLQKYKYYYPEFNFENVINRLLSVRKLKNGSNKKQKTGLFKKIDSHHKTIN